MTLIDIGLHANVTMTSMLTKHALHSMQLATYYIFILLIKLIFVRSIFLIFLFIATIRDYNTRGVQTLVQHSEGFTTIRTTNGPAQSWNRVYITTTETTQSNQPGKAQSNTTVRKTQSVQSCKTQSNTAVRTTYQSVQFSTTETEPIRTTQQAQFTETKDSKTVITTKNLTQLSEAKFGNSEGTKKKGTSKPFIYLTQTEKCLPKNLHAIGEENACNCDVIVLSFRTVCQEDNRTHISYIFVGEDSWNLGRHILYSIARERLPSYHYYIFLDDDVDI